MVGETSDPFTTVDCQPAYQSDTDYQSQLGKDDRMGTKGTARHEPNTPRTTTHSIEGRNTNHAQPA